MSQFLSYKFMNNILYHWGTNNRAEKVKESLNPQVKNYKNCMPIKFISKTTTQVIARSWNLFDAKKMPSPNEG